MASFSVFGGGGRGGSFAAPGAPDLSQKPPLSQPWQTLGQMNNPGMATYQGPVAPAGPNMGNEGQYPGVPIGAMPMPSDPGTMNGRPSPWTQPQMGGTTRRGSQILDAQGNVIGHYDNNNQPVYHGGQGGGGMPPSSGWSEGLEGKWGIGPYGSPRSPQGPVASTSMGMAPSYARLGVPGSMQQSLYGNGLLRPAMPSMNNQSGY